MSARTAYFTICARNYLGYARTLQSSWAASYGDRDFFIFLADSPDHADRLLIPGATVVTVNDLRLDRLTEMAFKYSVLEFSTSIKPHCFQYLFDVLNYDRIIYLDPDIYVLRRLEHVESALEQGAPCVLTPHITQPLNDGHHPSDIDILRGGVFNLGFAAFRKDDAAARYLAWWRAACEEACFARMDQGYFVDQRYCDLAPCFIPNLVSLTHPGYNLAYWNLAQRQVRFTGDVYVVNDLPLYFVHFSGISQADPDRFSKYQNRYRRKDLGDLIPLYDEYLEKLKNNDNQDGKSYSKMPYGYDYFKNGGKIVPALRRQYVAARDGKMTGLDPFELGPEFFQAVTPEDTDKRVLASALLSPSFMIRNLARRFTKGRERTVRYWERRIGPLTDA